MMSETSRATITRAERTPEVLRRLEAVVEGRGLTGLAAALAALGDFVDEDLQAVEARLKDVPRRVDLVGRSATHLLDLAGKRIRPLCVALAARLGSGFSGGAVELATAVELVHAATLLHDDVVDVGAMRRGQPAARVLYGNAASVFAGDWLLIEALRRVRRAEVPGVLDSLLATIDEMIQAEALQLERRGKLNLDRDTYFRIIDGKTASLFRWAMFAGGRSAGLPDPLTARLETYGRHLGLAFQIVDDALDLTGDAVRTGKALFADLREGKMTFPLLVGLERDPELAALLADVIGLDDAPPPALATRIVDTLARTGAIDAATQAAREHADRAAEALDGLPEGPGRLALAMVAEAAVSRSA
jgi:octaprenyl-diphosphate synthase